jgi:hypothetical protein
MSNFTKTGSQTGELAELTDAELDLVFGGKITPITEQVNGGGNTPNGQANGVPEVTVAAENPAGHRPPGQQP